MWTLRAGLYYYNQSDLSSLNAEKRRADLAQISAQNQAIFQRITLRQSEFRRQLWLDDWERTERRQKDIGRDSRCPAHKLVGPPPPPWCYLVLGDADHRPLVLLQRAERKVQFDVGDVKEHHKHRTTSPWRHHHDLTAMMIHHDNITMTTSPSQHRGNIMTTPLPWHHEEDITITTRVVILYGLIKGNNESFLLLVFCK